MKKIILSALLLPIFAFASIGKVTVVNGDAVVQNGAMSKKVVAGLQLEQKDVIKTAKGVTAQLVFNDKTVITIGSNTTFKVEEYLYDEKSPNARFKVEEGSFKTITGKIGKIAPDKFKMETKTATIGIRGTEFVGNVKPDGELTIACTKGAIVVTSTISGLPSVNVPAGEMTKATKLSVEQPVSFSPKELKTLQMPIASLKHNEIITPNKMGKDITSNVGQVNSQKSKEKTDTEIEKAKKAKKERD